MSLIVEDSTEAWEPDIPRTIVVIEDEGDIAEIIRFSLDRAGFDVRVARTGEAGLAIVRERADMILLDLNLPDMDGIEVCRRLRELPGAATIPIVVVSARSSEADRRRSIEAGANDYMVKPFSVRALVSRCHYGLFGPVLSRD